MGTSNIFNHFLTKSYYKIQIMLVGKETKYIPEQKFIKKFDGLYLSQLAKNWGKHLPLKI